MGGTGDKSIVPPMFYFARGQVANGDSEKGYPGGSGKKVDGPSSRPAVERDCDREGRRSCR